MLRDIQLAVRVGGGAWIGVLFFLIVVTLVPLALGPDLALLARIGPAILWLGALLANLLALDRLIAMDHEDGSLDLILTARVPLELALAAKALAHWLTTGLPLVIAAPLLGLLLNLEPKATGAVALTLLAGTPALTFIGLIGAALTVALRRGGLLLAILVMPLTIPVLDLRCCGVERGDRRTGPVRHAVQHSVRADAGEHGDRSAERRHRAAARTGIGGDGANDVIVKARRPARRSPHCGRHIAVRLAHE